MRSRKLWGAFALAAALTGLIATATLATTTQFGLPDPAKTPGAISTAVTQANISKTICVSGYTAKVRPPVTYTNALKASQIRAGYTSSGKTALADYEEDHLVPLEVGGNPRSTLNLWPEPRWGQWSAATKDKLENLIHARVCSRKLSLSAAQTIFSGNWENGYTTYIGTPPLPTTTTTHRVTTTTTKPPPVCHPKTPGGNCYKIGEYCSTAQHGTTGVASNGAAMRCIQVGTRWRWESA